MNIRKHVDYRAMYMELDQLMAENLPQVKLYFEIGRVVSAREEKGAAVAASEYLRAAYPDVPGFSPRNLRRMREFYRIYGADPEQTAMAMRIGWTQNVVILEAELTQEERTWYLLAAGNFDWTKSELTEKIKSSAHLEITLDGVTMVCYTEQKEDIQERGDQNDKDTFFFFL